MTKHPSIIFYPFSPQKNWVSDKTHNQKHQFSNVFIMIASVYFSRPEKNRPQINDNLTQLKNYLKMSDTFCWEKWGRKTQRLPKTENDMLMMVHFRFFSGNIDLYLLEIHLLNDGLLL